MDPTPLWLAAERAFPIVGVRADLDQRLGRDLTTALATDRMLVQAGIAERYPCPNSGGTDCPRRVVQRRQGGYRVICGSHPPACADLTLQDADVRIWRLAEDRLFGAIASALGLSGRLPSALPTVDAAWLVGAMAASTTQVVFLSQGDDGRIAAGITQVRDQFQGALQILVPRAGSVGALAHQAARQGVVICGLDEVLTGYDRGQFRSARPASGPLPRVVHVADARPEVAVAFVNGERQSLGRQQYEELRHRSGDFTVFADGFTTSVERSIGSRRERTQNVKASHFAALRIILEAEGRPVDMGTAEIPGVPTAGKQVFQAARLAIDIKNGASWHLFKNHQVERRSHYRFAPDAGVTSCFIFPVDGGDSAA